MLSYTQILDLFYTYKYLIIFPLVVIEGPVATIIGGFMVSLYKINIFGLFLIAVLGDLVGDLIYYTIGKYGGEKVVARWGTKIGTTVKKIDVLKKVFRKHANKALFFGKLSHGIGAAILITAGLVKMPLADFVKYSLVVSLPKTLILILIGYYFGSAFGQAIKLFNWLAVVTFVIAVVLLIIYNIISRVAKKFI